MPDFVSRIAQSAGNPLVLKLFARPARIKLDSSGLVPAIHAAYLTQRNLRKEMSEHVRA